MGLLVILSLLWLVFAPCALPVHAGYESMWADSATQPVPEGAKVTLEFDRPDYFLGENVLMHFVLQNTGETPFEASWGGDYRGASRHLRFKVTATDEAGQEAEDPDPWPMCMGGLGGPMTLKPNEKFTTSLPLMRYCDIVKPGVYNIRATHDFGWKEGERKRPVGETTITFHIPNAEQAERIVSEMAELPDWPDTSWGKRSAPYADFRCLRHPVYLDILATRARDGDERAFEGLGLIPTVKATETLIQLAGDPDKELALRAADTLNDRLPYPESHFIPSALGSSNEPQLSIRGRLVERAWDENLIPDVRALAAKLLASEDLPILATAAFMIVSVGTKEDAPAVIDAINRSRNPTHNITRDDPKDNILDFPQPIRELLRAMDALRDRGYSLGENVSGDAGILLYFHVLRDDPSPRPKRYRQFLEAFGTSSWFPIREAAVRSIPQPMPAECTDFVVARLEDRDLGVCRAACTAARASGNPLFIRPLLDIIATEHHEWLLREASAAAKILDAGFALLEVWADRLNEAGLYHLALDALQTVLEVPSGGHSGRTDLSRAERLELRKAWKEFLALHADEIRTGRRFNLSDPAVTPALVGRARSWRLPDGTSWPVLTETVVPN
jgi:HEAT repeat protein